MSGQPDLELTEEEKRATQESWDAVTGDLKESGIKFFLVFFRLFPEYSAKFKWYGKDTKLEDLPKNKRFVGHAFNIMNTLHGFMQNRNDPEVLEALLLKTGENHARRDLGRQDYKNVQIALVEYIKEELGEAFTPVMNSGWQKLLDAVTNKISQGTEEFDGEDD